MTQAAANIEVAGTDIAATTLHALFEFDGDLQTKLDFARTDSKKVNRLIEMQLLLLDEARLLHFAEAHPSFSVASASPQAPAHRSQ